MSTNYVEQVPRLSAGIALRPTKRRRVWTTEKYGFNPNLFTGRRKRLIAPSGTEVVAQTRDGNEAIRSFTRLRPDVVLIDLQVPRADGPEATRSIRSLHPDARLVVRTAYDGDGRIAAARHAGASAYLLKNVRVATWPTVREMQHGSHILSQALRREGVVRGPLRRRRFRRADSTRFAAPPTGIQTARSARGHTMVRRRSKGT